MLSNQRSTTQTSTLLLQGLHTLRARGLLICSSVSAQKHAHIIFVCHYCLKILYHKIEQKSPHSVITTLQQKADKIDDFQRHYIIDPLSEEIGNLASTKQDSSPPVTYISYFDDQGSTKPVTYPWLVSSAQSQPPIF